MKAIIGILVGSLLMPLYALQDYRCTEKALCELQEYREVSSIDEAFTQAEVKGNLRLAHINQENHAEGAADTYGTSIGGQLKYETAKISHISVAASAFVSQKIGVLSGDREKLNPDFFGKEGSSFAYLGEAYADYAYKQFDLRIGRQKLDTPLNDRDDIRMLPNTFEAAMAGYGGIEGFVFVGGYIQRWAGYDSGDDISVFKDVPGEIDAATKGKGVIVAGVMNESFENIEMQAWYYDFDKLAGVAYLDALYAAEYESGISIETGLQYGNYSESSASNIEGDVYGGMVSAGYAGLVLGAAFSDVHTPSGQTIILGYGGGPYYTSMEEMTIDSMNDAEAYVFGIEVDFSKMGLEGLSLYYAFGKFNGNDSVNPLKYEESDLVASYAFSDNADIEASYAYVDDKSNSGVNDTGYDRLLIRANYNF